MPNYSEHIQAKMDPLDLKTTARCIEARQTSRLYEFLHASQLRTRKYTEDTPKTD